jgi:hypothetical protein
MYRARGNGADYPLMRGASGQNCSSPPTNRRYRTSLVRPSQRHGAN